MHVNASSFWPYKRRGHLSGGGYDRGTSVFLVNFAHSMSCFQLNWIARLINHLIILNGKQGKTCKNVCLL